ncbi:hypothetical protein OIE67_25650 [Nonomuraea fuscirosea]|uniref:hypothetical protein n=1 Tax=Nonomuraea fuscirosea TaxID=1291556 RepID=UPI002DD88265|nr:hypothetical protein [Nonomuraea fuscirosea]WSA57881.1 hypothetical protein OIE67_25650 [Nonomuraea fuscirosea]
MHDSDAAGREMLADVRTLVGLLDAVDRAATPEEKRIAEEAVRAEGARQWAASVERNRQRLRDLLACDAILDASEVDR